MPLRVTDEGAEVGQEEAQILKTPVQAASPGQILGPGVLGSQACLPAALGTP